MLLSLLIDWTVVYASLRWRRQTCHKRQVTKGRDSNLGSEIYKQIKSQKASDYVCSEDVGTVPRPPESPSCAQNQEPQNKV